MATELQRRPISVDEYHRMAEAGIFRPGERVELLRGEIVTMPPIGDHHRGSVNRLTHVLSAKFADRVYIQVQNPVVVSDDSEPEPDIALLSQKEAAWGERGAYPSDVVVLIEVAESSRATDLRVKLPLYAQTGIAEYWIVDLIDRVIRIHREPTPEGYSITALARPGERIELSAFPNESLAVDDILPALPPAH